MNIRKIICIDKKALAKSTTAVSAIMKRRSPASCQACIYIHYKESRRRPLLLGAPRRNRTDSSSRRKKEDDSGRLMEYCFGPFVFSHFIRLVPTHQPKSRFGRQLRGLPHMMTSEFWYLFTPSPLVLIQNLIVLLNSRNLFLYFIIFSIIPLPSPMMT